MNLNNDDNVSQRSACIIGHCLWLLYFGRSFTFDGPCSSDNVRVGER